MTRFHISTDAQTGDVTQTAFTAAEEAAADAADAASNSEATRQNTFTADAGVAALISQLKTANASQIDSWLTTNVTNLAQARTVLGYVIKLLAVAIRQQLN